ncbi:MAG: pilus assembly protein [Nitrospira sp.]
MRRRNLALRGTVILALGSGLMGPVALQAQTMDQYYAVPPFVADQVAPNIMLLLDNSGSMADRSCDPTWCGVHSDGSLTPVNQNFDATSTYSGFFDVMKCYTYDSTNTRFESAASKVSLSAGCPATTQWDGNLLNWATFRRFDALKKAMSGGDCVVTRNADGTCPPSGTTAKITITAQRVFDNTSRGHETMTIPSGAGNGYQNRIPTAATPGTPATLRIYLRGGTNGMGGTFCIDDDGTAPSNTATTCNDGDVFAESQYSLRVVAGIEPTGVVQQIGPQARFGLFEFKPAGDGARMLVGIGSRQSINFNGTAVETFNTNTAAILDALGESFPSTWTPLSESLYETTRYIAQINSSYLPGSYVYPIAYSGGGSDGVAFQASGTGSIGGSEISALTPPEVCPAGYINNACGRDPYFFGSNHAPAWATSSVQVACCKTFVILVTDGEPTQDTNIPVGLRDYAHGRHGLHCIGGNATIHAPDGTCNTNTATPAATLLGEHKQDYASSGNHYLDDVAYWAHTNDLRPCNGTADGLIPVLNVTGHCLQGFQNVTVYTFFAFGNIAGREILMHAAQLGGFEDSNNNNLPDLVSEWDKVINATGAPGTDGIPDNYFESSNVNDLQDRLMATITAILRKSASGTSVSVLSSSSTGEGSIYQAYFFTSDIGQSGANVKWTGYAHGLFVDGFGNFREDTVKDGVLDYKNDLIITTRYDNNPLSPTYRKVLVDKYVDLNGDGVADNPTPTILGDDLKNIKPIWEAGAELANIPSASRKILTWVDSNSNGLVDPAEQIDFSTVNCNALRDYLRYPGDVCSGSSNAMNLINFIRGDEVAGLRTRMIETPLGSGTFKVWKLGDAIHSTPTIVAAPRARFDLVYGDASYNAFYLQYRNRRQVMYLGANDGMLHAFNGGFYHRGDDPATPGTVEHGWFTKNPTDNSGGPNLGGELWGFVPMQLLPQLQWLARTDYTHVYYADLKPTVADVRIFTPDADHPGGWGTILIGGFRMGGSCGRCVVGSGAPPMTATIGGVPRTFYSAFFVLDITNPEVDPKLLWTFSDIDLGLTTSTPTVVRTNPTGDAITSKVNEKWYVVFGSGPNSYQGDLPTPPTQSAALYTVDLAAGPGIGNVNVTRMPVGTFRSFMTGLISADKDLDFRTDVVYAGRTMHDGSLPWRGKMYRLTVGCAAAPCLPISWGIASGGNRVPTEMIDTFNDPLLGTVELGPVTAAPTWTIDDSNQVWVFFGTGRYIGNSDKVDNAIQRLYGMKDKVVNGFCTQTNQLSCWTNDLVDATNAVVCIVCSGSTNQVTDPTNTGVTTFNGTGTTSMVGLVASKDGWRVTLPGPVSITNGGIVTNYSAERSVVIPALFGGTIFFPTFTPTSDFCASDGASYLYALFYKTGTASASPVIGTSTSGSNTNVTTKVSLGVGMASALSVHFGYEGGGGGGTGPGAKVCSQMSNSSTICTNTGKGDTYSRFVSWVHQRD